MYGVNVVKTLTVEKLCSPGMLSSLWRAVCGPKQGMYVWGAADGGISLWACSFSGCGWGVLREEHGR